MPKNFMNFKYFDFFFLMKQISTISWELSLGRIPWVEHKHLPFVRGQLESHRYNILQLIFFRHCP